MDNYTAYSPCPDQMPYATATYHDFLIDSLNALQLTAPKGQGLRELYTWIDDCLPVLDALKLHGKRPDQWLFAQMLLAEALVGRSFDRMREVCEMFEERRDKGMAA